MKRQLRKALPLLPLLLLGIYLVYGDASSPEDPSATDNEISNTNQGNISRVIDGDTLETREGMRIRLIGINTPEKGQPYGEEAINEMRRLTANKNIELKFDDEKKDMYDRTLAYAYVEDIFINSHMVRQGLALVETVPPNEMYEGIFMEAEEEARNNCRGLWEGLCVAGAHSDRCIEISQINADAPGNDNKNLNGEWIRLHNKCPEDIPLDGYLLKDRSASNDYFFKNTTLHGDSSVTLYSGCGEDSQNTLYWQCPQKRSAIWNNDGDQAYLYNKEGTLVTTKGY